MRLFKNAVIQAGLVFLLVFQCSADMSKKLEEMPKKFSKKQKTVDHDQHEILKQKFKSGKELTDACLSCHNLADEQFRKTIHWTWQADNADGRHYGKVKDSFNNFCISTNGGQDKSCLDCHPGWGREFESVNCLNCHIESSFKFEETLNDIKAFLDEGDEESIEMASELQAEVSDAIKGIGSPTRKNCGSCHFYGGGGDGVKHGDLDSSLVSPDRKLDVHMGGAGFECVRCHTTEEHRIAGRVYSLRASSDKKSLIDDDKLSKITCEACHTEVPHKTNSKLNDHTDIVACQTCHIPAFAREKPTKMAWDWSQAGKLKDGKPYSTEDQFGRHDYLSIKGKFRWDKNVVPEYLWYNGSIESITVEDTIDDSLTSLAVSKPVGSIDDKASRIYPFKVHTGRQPYDTETKKLLIPLLSGDDGFWKTFNWEESFEIGAKLAGKTFSGHYDFINTTYVFPITHMVAPKEDALSCKDCHSHNGSRLAKISGLYLPGRDTFKQVDSIGWMIIIASLAGVLLHSIIRILFGGRKKH